DGRDREPIARGLRQDDVVAVHAVGAVHPVHAVGTVHPLHAVSAVGAVLAVGTVLAIGAVLAVGAVFAVGAVLAVGPVLAVGARRACITARTLWPLWTARTSARARQDERRGEYQSSSHPRPPIQYIKGHERPFPVRSLARRGSRWQKISGWKSA